jgi:PAS domain S-box-containing protein
MLSLALACLGAVLVLGVDLVTSGYAIAAAYLVLVSFAAIALRLRTAVIAAAVGLALTVAVMVLQGRTDAQNLLLVWFGVLAGAGMLALVSLYTSVEELYESEHGRTVRTAFLVDLVDALLLLSDPAAVRETFARMLGDELAAGRTAFYERDESGQLTERCSHGGSAPPGPLDLEPFRSALETAPPGSALVLTGEDEDGAPATGRAEALEAAGVRACLAASLRLEGELAAAIAVCDAAPREWTEDERALLAESAGRAWAEVRRARSDALVAFQAHLLANVHDAIVALDVHSRVTYWNEAAEDLFGWTPDEALGSPAEGLLDWSLPGSDGPMEPAALLHDGRYRGEVRCRHKDGHELWADVHAREVRSETGVVEGSLLTARDISEQRRTREALAWEAARLRAIVDAAPVGLGIVAADGEVLLRNDVLRRIWMGEAPVHSVEEFDSYNAYWPDTSVRLRPEDWPAARALKDGSSFADLVVDIERFDGTRGTIVLSSAPIIHDEDILGAVTIVQDITDVREAEQALRFLTEEVRALHEGLVTGRALSSAEVAADVVAQAAQLLGSDGASIFLLGEDGALRRVAGVGVPDPREVDDLVAEAVGERRTSVAPGASGDTDAETGGGLLAVPLMIRDTMFGAMSFTYEDRRRLDEARVRIAGAFADQAALAIENTRLRSHIEEAAAEAERTRLARDLHDSVTQSLFAASLKAEALAESLQGGRDPVDGTAEELRRLTRGALAGMRTMLLEMRPDGLARTPLPELLRHLVEASGGRIGADVCLEVRGEHPVPAEVRGAFYRIAQEALNNVARHARASDVQVELTLDDHVARLEVTDDGQGFDPDDVPPGHFGLSTMRERAEAIGARLTIATGSGRGTVVIVEWPLGNGERRHDRA